MADLKDIQKVKDNIESDAAAHGFGDSVIGARLDGGASVTRVIATYWRKRASDTLQLVNTSEAGSSRGNDSIYPRMDALAQRWEAAATAEETIVADTTTRARNGTIVRK